MMMTSVTIWLGIIFLLGFMASQMTVMSWADYSYVMPAGAFGYALQTLMAVLILHETVSFRRWIGVLLICVGVVLVGQTKPRTTTCAVSSVAAKAAEKAGAEKVAASC
jgi:drug/metabolite transporter (DMT)-like permease